jgi:phage terminase large subunit-like protein
VFLYVGKKNGKSSFSAALILLVMATDQEQGAEVYSAASTQKQAGLVFDHAAGMVRQEPRLKRRLQVYGDRGGSVAKSIVDYETMSSYKCLASDADSADGVNPHLNVIDEVHRHRTGELMDVLVRSTSTRRQPLTIYTTTADYNRPSACNDLRKYALSVRENDGDAAKLGHDPAFLPVVYEATIEDDPGARETWLKANPGLGLVKSEEAMAKAYREAREIPSKLNSFLRLDLNIVTDVDEAWLDMAAWDGCAGEHEIEPGGMEDWIERMPSSPDSLRDRPLNTRSLRCPLELSGKRESPRLVNKRVWNGVHPVLGVRGVRGTDDDAG